MNNEKISSFEIKKHNKFSWSYVYTIDAENMIFMVAPHII